jgi:aryl-alcohol dehydrogenase-like predicted oxidoreductase
METRKLGNSDLKITPVGFGAWAIGGSGWEFAWGQQDDNDSIAAIQRALEVGVNWIDTAAVYGTGHSEEVVARALKGWSGPRPYIFTKCVLTWDANRKVSPNHSAASIRKECQDSLRRLQIDTIDLYQMHWPPSDNGPGLEEAWTAMSELQKAAKSAGLVFRISTSSNSSVPDRSHPSPLSSRPIPSFAAILKRKSFPTAKRTASA